MKSFGQNLHKNVKDFHKENYKTLKKKKTMIANLENKICCVQGVEKNNAIKMSILFKASYRFNMISNKIPNMFISDLEKATLTFIWNQTRTGIAKVIQNSTNETGSVTACDLKRYFWAVTFKTICSSIKNRHVEQWNRPVTKKFICASHIQN